jgi:hypothetical protein
VRQGRTRGHTFPNQQARTIIQTLTRSSTSRIPKWEYSLDNLRTHQSHKGASFLVKYSFQLAVFPLEESFGG